jgi:ubiquinone/menaquinone biosynthesis C-methylase UbiE
VSSHGAYTGSVPPSYDRYLGPVLFEPYAEDLAGRLPDGDGLRVLELACGTGILTRRLRESLPPSAALVATDLNSAMITYARTAVNSPGIDWRQADAGALEFGDGAFDVVACQFGFMFPPDKPRAFSEARRVLAPRGMLLASVWKGLDDNPVPRAVQAVVEELWPDDPPTFLSTPYGYWNHEVIRRDLSKAGFATIELEDVHLSSSTPSARDVARGYAAGTPLAHELLERGADTDAVVDAIASKLSPTPGVPLQVQHAAVVVRASA